MSIHVKSASILLIVLGLSFTGVGCADLESDDLNTAQGQKKYGQDEYGDSYDWLEGTDDDSYDPYEDPYDPYGSSDNTDNGTSVYETPSSSQDNTTSEYNEWEEEQNNEYVPASSTTSGGNVGDQCAPGCIWSAYAVSIGAQSSEATCNGAGCACVQDNDVWSLCSESGTTSQPQDSTPSQPQNTSPSTPSNYDAYMGGRLADAARYEANRRGTTGYCYTAVADAIESLTGRFLYGASAYMAADQLAAHRSFTEVYVNDLTQLPAGAVVVWARGSSAHGHISVALGNGYEASDHIAYQMTYHYGGGSARVFYPNGR